MNTEVRDALPDLAHGRLNELNTATMTAHVESCADCRAELALMREVRDSAPLTPRLDAVQIAAAVPAYGGAAVMRNPPVQRPEQTFLRYSLIAAAAVVIVAFGGLAINNRDQAAINNGVERAASAAGSAVSSGSAVAAGNGAAPSSEQTASGPVEAARGIPSSERQVAALSLVGGTQDLSDSQLETLLSELDGMESLPSAEPQSVTPSVENIESDQ